MQVDEQLLDEAVAKKGFTSERFEYCNGSSMVLALILERITGQTFHEVVRQHVLEPAGWEDTGFLRRGLVPVNAPHRNEHYGKRAGQQL